MSVFPTLPNAHLPPNIMVPIVRTDTVSPDRPSGL